MQPIITKLNHVAIATRDLEAARTLYSAILGAKVSPITLLHEHGVSAIFVDLGHSNIECIEPLGRDSPIEKFLQRNPNGGIHHVCYNTPSLQEACIHLEKHGYRVLGNPKIGFHKKPVIFLHPSDFLGTLIELEET